MKCLKSLCFVAIAARASPNPDGFLCSSPVGQDASSFVELNSSWAAAAARDISAGRVHVANELVHPDLVRALERDLMMLFNDADSRFKVAGLTETASGQQFSSRKDRSVATWTTLDAGGSEASVGDDRSRQAYRLVIRKARDLLAQALDRKLLDTDGELYYSHYGHGAKVDMHFDEFHEELKGAKGWLVPQRRSVTWLLYINPSWDLDRDGGGLRAFELNASCTWPVGADGNNLQVGWHVTKTPSGTHASPVFLDAFLGPQQLDKALYYRLNQRRKYISPAFADSISYSGLSKVVFPEEAEHFIPLNRDRVRSEELLQERIIAPGAGTLVFFDSVAVPHDTTPAVHGRLAVAGWFYEAVALGT